MKTRRMFLVALCGVAMLIGASSCKKEKQENENGETMTIKASLSSVDNNSKTHLEGKKVMWDMGDAFKLFRTVSTESTKFSLTRIDETDGKVAYFEGKHPGDAPYYACYPFNNVSCKSADETKSVFEFEIPKSQSDVTNAGPMVGFMEKASGSLVFQNAMSWLKVGLKGNAIIKRITLTDLSGVDGLTGTTELTEEMINNENNKKLNGTLTVTCSGNTESTFGFETVMSGGTNQLEIVSSTGIALGEDYRPFWFLVPNGSLESLELCVYVSDAVEATPVLTLNKKIIGGMQENTILSANVTSTPVNYTSPTLTLQICKDCKQTILGNYTAGVPTTAKFGVCYVETTAGTEIPTIEDTKVEIGTLTATGNYNVDLDEDLGLDHSKIYRVRTYVDNGVVTYSDKVYTVDWPRPLPSTWTNGKNPHPFTVGSGKVVYFSQGNLQYNATGSSATAESGTNVGGTWRFAEHQFDFVGDATMGNVYAGDRKCDNSKVAQTYNDWIDLFGWGTSGYNHGANCYQPWSTSIEVKDYYVYSDYTYNLEDGPTSQMGKADWGKANIISNGGDNNWRTLTKDEWNSLINRKDSNGKLLYGEGRVGNCIPGLIILPDDWNCPDELTDVVRGESPWSNVYSYLQWSLMEKAGAIFLPAAGHRNGTKVYYVCEVGNYWSSSYYDDKDACRLLFGSNSVASNYNNGRYGGRSVRLVTEN